MNRKPKSRRSSRSAEQLGPGSRRRPQRSSHSKTQSNDEQQNNEEFYRLLVETTAEGVWMVDRKGHTTYVNHPMAEMLGYARDEMIGRPAADFKFREDRPAARQHLKQRFANPCKQQYERRYQRRDGSAFWALVTSSPVYDARGRVAHLLGMFTDITMRKRDHEQLHEVIREKDEILALLDALFQSAPIGLGFWDRELRFVRLNHALAEMNGLPIDAHLGKTLEEVAPGIDQLPKIMRTWRCIIETGGPVMNAEVSGQTAAQRGQTRHWMENWFPVKVDGRTIGLGATVLDITDRKHAEADRKALNNRLEETVAQRTKEARQRTAQLQKLALDLTLAEQRERQRMAAVLHDGLQQLLYAAQYETEFLSKHVRKPVARASLKRLNERLRQGVESCRALNLDLSPPRLRQGRFGKALKWLADWMRDNHGLTVELQVKSLPRLSESSRVLLFQAARELLFNVVKHAKVNTASLKLERLNRCEVQLTVSDRGVGMKRQPRTVKRKSRAGWGLANLRDRVEFVGGSFAWDRLTKTGTRITVRLPIAVAQSLAEAT